MRPVIVNTHCRFQEVQDIVRMFGDRAQSLSFRTHVEGGKSLKIIPKLNVQFAILQLRNNKCHKYV